MIAVKSSQKFEELYNKLNPKQKETVDTIEGPVMVAEVDGYFAKML